MPPTVRDSEDVTGSTPSPSLRVISGLKHNIFQHILVGWALPTMALAHTAHPLFSRAVWQFNGHRSTSKAMVGGAHPTRSINFSNPPLRILLKPLSSTIACVAIRHDGGHPPRCDWRTREPRVSCGL